MNRNISLHRNYYYKKNGHAFKYMMRNISSHRNYYKKKVDTHINNIDSHKNYKKTYTY
jgi:hypothetical protein